jgi:hypothetical protein
VEPEEYKAALEAVVAEMRKQGIWARCEGVGLHCCIYAEKGSRAVEISGVLPGASLEAYGHGSPLSSPDWFETLEAAAAEAIAWLTWKG